MGIITDVTRPIRDALKPTEGLGRQLVWDRLEPVFYETTKLLVDLKLRQIRTQVERTIIHEV